MPIPWALTPELADCAGTAGLLQGLVRHEGVPQRRVPFHGVNSLQPGLRRAIFALASSGWHGTALG